MEVTLIVEDGTGYPNATAYVEVEDLKQYWYSYGYNYDALDDNSIRRLINRASAYIDNNYRNGFPGVRQHSTQSMEWPRFGAFYLDNFQIEENTVPPEIRNAVNEMVYLISQGNDPNAIIDKNGRVIAESSQVDVIKESLKYEDGSGMYTDIYPSIDNALSRITGGVSDRFVLDIIRIGGESP